MGLCLLGCDSELAVGQARLALDGRVLPGADAVVLRVLTPDGEEDVRALVPPWPAEVVLEVSPGPNRIIQLEASALGVPYALGEAHLESVEAGQTVDAEVVVDLVGVLEVVPLGLATVQGVLAAPRDPYEGQPRQVLLEGTEVGFRAVLPAGRYDLTFRLDLPFLSWVPAAAPEVEVVPGLVRTWAEPLVAPDVPLPEPGPAVRLVLEVAGNLLPGGILPEPADLVVRALDAEGRQATGYRGVVSFRAAGGLIPALLPDPHAFTEEDAGAHRFADGLQAPVTLVAGLLRLVASDNTGLETTLELRVVPP